MPTLRYLVKRITELEKIDKSQGAYPIMFKNDWEKIKFILLLRFEHIKIKVKKICHL